MAEDANEKTSAADAEAEAGVNSGPQGSQRSERRVFGRELRSRPRRGQQYIFVGLAVLFLFGWIMFRKGCSDRIGQTFGTVTAPSAKDGGAHTKPPRPRPKNTDPDDW